MLEQEAGELHVEYPKERRQPKRCRRRARAGGGEAVVVVVERPKSSVRAVSAPCSVKQGGRASYITPGVHQGPMLMASAWMIAEAAAVPTGVGSKGGREWAGGRTRSRDDP